MQIAAQPDRADLPSCRRVEALDHRIAWRRSTSCRRSTTSQAPPPTVGSPSRCRIRISPDGQEVIVEVQLPERMIYAKVYKFQVGRVPLYMLDTDIHPNAPADRELSSRLYGATRRCGSHRNSCSASAACGRCGRWASIPQAFHMNEGHAAFLVLELARERVEKGESFAQALTRGEPSAPSSPPIRRWPPATTPSPSI